MSRSVMKSVNAVMTVMNVWLIVSEQETQEIQGVSEQVQLQQANETIAKLSEQRKPTSQSQSELFCTNSWERVVWFFFAQC